MDLVQGLDTRQTTISPTDVPGARKPGPQKVSGLGALPIKNSMTVSNGLWLQFRWLESRGDSKMMLMKEQVHGISELATHHGAAYGPGQMFQKGIGESVPKRID